MYPFKLINEVLKKRVWVAMLACAALGAWAQSSKEPYMAPRPTKPLDYDAVMQRLEQQKNVCSPDGRSKLAEARQKLPELAGLSDESTLNVIHRVYYPHMDKEQLASKLCIQWPPEKAKPKLGPLDQWRYESCRSDAAKAPTERGVSVGLNLCREKFGQ
jgi:hypothetical protein